MTKKKDERFDHAGAAAGGVGSSQNYSENVIMQAARGHGFAAEKANHLYDKLSGKDAKQVGGDNVKNGADRIVDGVKIQTKYCNSGSKCVSECFENGVLRYRNGDGSPMQIEVPSDKYEDAVKAMADRIKKGQVPGVDDPQKAKDIVRKGHFTYEQARRISQAGTIESLTYDAVNGIKLAGTAAGISAAISFAVAVWNGEEYDAAFEGACYTGLKVGGVAWIGSIVTAQVGRTGIEQGLRSTTDWIVQQIGPKAAHWISQGVSGKAIYGAAATNHVSKLLRGNVVTAAVTTVILSSVDLYRLFSGHISGAQLFKNVASTAAGVAGGVVGWEAGAAAGAALGSFIPGAGTVIGGFLGGLIGAFAGGTVAQSASSAVLDQFIEDDAKEMMAIVEDVFVEMAHAHLLGKPEAEMVLGKITALDIPETLREMYASTDRRDFASRILSPMFEQVVRSRKKITLPSDEQWLVRTGKLIDAFAEAPDESHLLASAAT